MPFTTSQDKEADKRFRREYGPAVAWAITLFLFLLSIIMLALTIFAGVPLTSPDDTEAAYMNFPNLWLITVNETTSTTGPKAPGQLKHGFGVWGWCSWSDTAEAQQGLASCTRTMFWKIPGGDSVGDSVEGLNLPDSIGQSLSIASFFLIFAFALVVIAAFCHLIIANFRAGQPPCTKARKKDPNLYKKGKKVRLAIYVRNLWIGLGFYLASLGCILPTLFCVGLGKSHYSQADTGGYDVELGSGCCVLIIVIFAELGGFLGIWYGGLYNHRDYWPGTATGWEVVQRGSGR